MPACRHSPRPLRSIYAIYEGTSEIQRLIISRLIFGNHDLVTP